MSASAAGDGLAHPALVDDGHAVGDGEDLVEVLADEQDGRPAGALREQQPVDGLDGAHVQAARGLHGHEHARPGADLAGQDEPLEVAAREEAGLGVDRRGGDLVGLLELLGAVARHEAVDGPAMADGRGCGSSS